MSDQSHAIRKKIAALLKLTTAAGCTEGEALAAAAKAAELMREHGMSEISVQMAQSDARIREGARSVRATLWTAVARCTNTACIHLKDGDPVVRFFGRDPGPEIAGYLAVVLNRAIDREIRLFKSSETYCQRRTLKTKRKAVRDFTSALVSRLSLRLLELFMSQISRAAAVDARTMLDSAFPVRRSHPVKATKTRFDAAAGAGWRAGSNVELSHGVKGGAAARQIGKSSEGQK